MGINEYSSKEVVLKEIIKNGLALEYVNEKLRDDRDIILIAVKQNGRLLEYASDKLKSNFNFLSEVVEKIGAFLLDRFNLSNTYKDLKLKHDMQSDLNTDSKFKAKIKKF